MSLREALRREIIKGLPGEETQWELSSSIRMLKDFPQEPQPDTASAAVLVLLYPFSGTVHTVFIQRPEYNGVHGGQISFPGGKMEKTDKDIVNTALREAEEETGIEPGKAEITGVLTPLYIPVSNIIVTPVVAWMDARPAFQPEKNEVLFIIEAGLPPFLDYSILRTKPFEIRGEMFNIKYFDYKGHVIWGATAMILNELLTVIKRTGLSLTV